jgi:hypothetical protein
MTRRWLRRRPVHLGRLRYRSIANQGGSSFVGNRDAWPIVSNRPQVRFDRVRHASVWGMVSPAAPDGAATRLPASVLVMDRMTLTARTRVVDSRRSVFAVGDLAGPRQLSLIRVRRVFASRLGQLTAGLLIPILGDVRLGLGRMSILAAPSRLVIAPGNPAWLSRRLSFRWPQVLAGHPVSTAHPLARTSVQRERAPPARSSRLPK